MIKASCFCMSWTTGIVFGFTVLMVSGCVSPSPPGEVAIATVQEVQQGSMESGIPLRWGGTITHVRNKKDITVLEIVSRPLLRSGRPRHNDQTDGRFMAEISGFLDPEIVRAGRDISVIGTITRLENGQVGEAEYQYPVMSVFNYRFWKKASEIDANSGYPHYFERDRFWYNWPYRRRNGVHGRVLF